MSDWFAGKITIGGKLSRRKVQGLAKAVIEDGAGPDGDCKFPDEAHVVFAIENAAIEGTAFEVMDDEARYGEFEAIEDFCQENHIPFICRSEAFGEYEAQMGVYDGGSQSSSEFPLQQQWRSSS